MSEQCEYINCNECNFKIRKSDYNDYEKSLQKHKWKYHPKNHYEKTWSKHALEGFKNWRGSSYYESYGPYY